MESGTMNNEKEQDMDSSVETTTASEFRTPPRILIPKLVISRDKWKAKATARKRQFHKERIRSRDLTLSRQLWKERFLAAEADLQEVRQTLQRSEADIAEARSQLAQLQDESKKN